MSCVRGVSDAQRMSREGRAAAYALLAVVALSVPVVLVLLLQEVFMLTIAYWLAPLLNLLSRR
ncbi:hypothetical protein GCM10022247_69440 [Allokutzneria multivorans]|uniref:Uncharacterized protein n=2 Tax=Allokutzneria multivorans TaxID=1142134 RepID=A0ABP7U1C5_9PSEU